MPTYLCHGFRWHRRSIRVYVIVQNIDDAAADWVVGPATSGALLESFYRLFSFLPRCTRPLEHIARWSSRRDDDYEEDDGESGGDGSLSRRPSEAPSGKTAPKTPMSGTTASARESEVSGEAAEEEEDDGEEYDEVLGNDWSVIKLLEEYDPLDLQNVSRPYAYVADHVVRIDLSVSVAEEIAAYEEQRLAKGAVSVWPEGPPMSGHISDEFAAARAAASGGKGSKTFGSAKEKDKGGTEKTGWFEKLRDQLQRGEEIRWYIVVCGDEERGLVLDGDDESTGTRPQRPPQRPKIRSLVNPNDPRGGGPVPNPPLAAPKDSGSAQQQQGGGSIFPQPSYDPQPHHSSRHGGGKGGGSSSSGGGLRKLFGRSGSKGGGAGDTSP